METPEHNGANDAESIENLLDLQRPGWEGEFGADLFEGMDVRGTVMRTRAFLRYLQSTFETGPVSVSGDAIAVQQTIATLLKIVADQMEGPTMIGTRKPSV